MTLFIKRYYREVSTKIVESMVTRLMSCIHSLKDTELLILFLKTNKNKKALCITLLGCIHYESFNLGDRPKYYGIIERSQITLFS